MNRKDFLAAMGITAAAFAIINCVGCSKGGEASSSSSGVSGPTGVDFTLELTTSTNAAIQTNGVTC